MTNFSLKDFASGVLLGTTPGVTRPTVAAPNPFDNEERMDISDRFRPTPSYTSPDSFYSGTSVGGQEGETYYTGALDITGVGANVGDKFVGMDKYLGAGISPLGFNPLISAGSAISKKNLTNIQNKMRDGEEGYAVGMLGDRIVGVSPGPFGGYVLSGVLPQGLTAGQQKQIIDQLLSMGGPRPETDEGLGGPAGDIPDPDTGLTTPESEVGAGSFRPGIDTPATPSPDYTPPPSYDYYGDPGDDSGPPPGNEYTVPSSPAPDYTPPPSYDYYGDPGDSSGSAGTPTQYSMDDGGEDTTSGYDFGGEDSDSYQGYFAAGGKASKDPVQSTGFVDGPPQNYAKGTTVADTENHRVRVGSFVLNAPTTERLQKEGKLPKGPQKRKAAKGGKMMEVALSKGEYVIDVNDISKFGGYDALNKENDKGKPEVERRQAAAQGGFLGGYSDGGILRYAGPLSTVELVKSGLNLSAPTQGFVAQKEYDAGGLPPYTVNDIDIGAVQKALTLVETRGYEDRNEGYFFTRSDKTGKESSAFGPLQITKKTLEAMKTDRFGQLDLAFETEPGLKQYYEKLITEGRNALNVKKYEDIYTGPEGSSKKTNASEEEKAKYRGLGYGNIPLEEHKKYYPTIAALYMRYKAGMSDSEEDLVRRHFGNNASTQKYYAAKEELGISQ